MKRYNTLLLGGVLSVFMVGCPTERGDGGINVNVDVAGLLSEQSFCMSWSLYQAAGESWDLIDQRAEPICAQAGTDFLSDFATCYDGRRFLVQYDIEFYDPDGLIGTAKATSGGGPDDLCVKNTDTDSRAVVQFNNEGNAGGVNPGVEVDQVCSNDKVELENGQLVSALWLQPEDCTSGIPDSFCSLGVGEGLTTVRTGVTLDGLTRYIFSTSSLDASWEVVYLSFDANLAPGILHLYNSSWALFHYSYGAGDFGRFEVPGVIGTWRIDNPGNISLGGAAIIDGDLVILSDQSGSCDAEISLDAQYQLLEIPSCGSGDAEALGLISTGGSHFSIIFGCNGDILEIACDANAIGGSICGSIIP